MRTFLIFFLISPLGCGSPVLFQGQSTLEIAGTPPTAEPPAPPPRVEVRENQIEIHEKIQFDFDKATIKPASDDLMNEIGSVITKNPQIKRIRIEGYASSEGDPNHNRTLSDQRAKAVMKYLTDHGVSAKELTAVGYGADKPIGDNTTDEGREKNRRVEFAIVEQDVTKKRVEVDPQTGKENVIEENHETVKSSNSDAKAPVKPTTNASQAKGKAAP